MFSVPMSSQSDQQRRTRLMEVECGMLLQSKHGEETGQLQDLDVNKRMILTLILQRSRTGTVWFYQQQESSTTKTVHKVINKGLKTYV